MGSRGGYRVNESPMLAMIMLNTSTSRNAVISMSTHLIKHTHGGGVKSRIQFGNG